MIDANEVVELGPGDGWVRIDAQFKRDADWPIIEGMLVTLMKQWFNKVSSRHYEVILPPSFRYVHKPDEKYVRVFCEGRLK